jgi:uncharacterized membrane protein
MQDLLAKEFSLVCGQDPAHTWASDDGLMPLCQRCTGIYAGALAAAIVHLAVRPAPSWRLLALHGALIAQVVPAGLGLVPQGPYLRALSGALFALGAVHWLWALPGARLAAPLGKQRRREAKHLALATAAVGVVLLAVAVDRTAVRQVLAWCALFGLAALATLAAVNVTLLARAFRPHAHM